MTLLIRSPCEHSILSVGFEVVSFCIFPRALARNDCVGGMLVGLTLPSSSARDGSLGFVSVGLVFVDMVGIVAVRQKVLNE